MAKVLFGCVWGLKCCMFSVEFLSFVDISGRVVLAGVLSLFLTTCGSSSAVRSFTSSSGVWGFAVSVSQSEVMSITSSLFVFSGSVFAVVLIAMIFPLSNCMYIPFVDLRTITR